MPAVQNFNGRLNFANNALTVEQCRGELSGGHFTVTGGVTFPTLRNEDLNLALKAESVLIERMPGKSTVGIQVPNEKRETIWLREVIEAPGYPVEVYNILGAGDAFGAGFLYGYIHGWDWRKAARLGNACGASCRMAPFLSQSFGSRTSSTSRTMAGP